MRPPYPAPPEMPRAAGAGSRKRAPVLLALLALAACAPVHDPEPRCRWPGFRCAVGGPPRTLAAKPPVVVDNPFRCPRRASP
jgi:hypothetical protein